MPTSRTLRTVVQPGGRIEVAAPDLPAGQTVEVTINSVPDEVARRPLREIIARGIGHRSFQTADEVEAYINAERDTWDR
ncbi:MAG: hypothetical protein AB1716_01485 [Planctomycetota bacterium]